MEQPETSAHPSPARHPKPGVLQALSIITLISGIINILVGLGGIVTIVWILPGVFSIVVGIMEIVYATKILPDPIRATKPSRAIAILEIINIISGSGTSLVVGILALVFYSNKDVADYFNQQAR